MKSTIKTDFATFTMVAFDNKQPLEVNSLKDMPFGYFNAGNARGDTMAIALQVANHGLAPHGYQLDNLAGVLNTAVESMLEKINTDVAGKLRGTDSREFVESVAHLKFEYNYPRGGSFPGLHGQDREGDDSHQSMIKELLAGAVDIAPRVPRTPGQMYYFARDYSVKGWEVTGAGISFKIISGGLYASFMPDSANDADKETNKFYGLTAKLDDYQGYLSLSLAQLTCQDRIKSGRTPEWSTKVRLGQGFWADVLTELNAGIAAYNKVANLPERLKVRELSSINYDKMVAEDLKKGVTPSMVFDINELRSWFLGRY